MPNDIVVGPTPDSNDYGRGARISELPPGRVVGPLEQLAARVDGLAAQLQATEKWNSEQAAQILELQTKLDTLCDAQIAALERIAVLERGQGEPMRIGGDS